MKENNELKRSGVLLLEYAWGSVLTKKSKDGDVEGVFWSSRVNMGLLKVLQQALVKEGED